MGHRVVSQGVLVVSDDHESLKVVIFRHLTLSSSHFTCRTASFISGAEGIRTPDLRRAKAALSRLSYGPGVKG